MMCAAGMWWRNESQMNFVNERPRAPGTCCEALHNHSCAVIHLIADQVTFGQSDVWKTVL